MNQTIKAHIKSLKIIHFAMILGVLLFLFISLFINQTTGVILDEEDNTTEMLFLVITNVFFIGSLVLGSFLFKKRIKNIESFDFDEKIIKYRKATLIRTAMLESSTFLFVLSFLLFGSIVFIVEAFLGLFLMSFFFPTKLRISKEMKYDLRNLQ